MPLAARHGFASRPRPRRSPNSETMRHAVEKYFRKEQDKATQSFRPISKVYFEQEIGLKAHIQREMPLFLTLRDDGRHAARYRDAAARAGATTAAFARSSSGPAMPIPIRSRAMRFARSAQHYGMTLERARCYPYRRD